MGFLAHIRHTFRRYKKDEGGTIAMLFGLVFMTLLLAVGVGYDYSQLTHAYAKSQSVSDQTALQAAIYVRNNGQKPTSSQKGLVHGHTYKADELGHHYNAFVRDGASGVNVKVEYDDVKREVTAYVSGKTVPAFLQVFGYGDLSFQTRSTAKYSEVDVKDPASVFLVLDNSGSMAWDDRIDDVTWDDDIFPWSNVPDAQSRINGLKTTVNDFMAKLNSVIGARNANQDKVLRTGMLAYNSEIISGRTVPPFWGTLSTNQVNSMVAKGGTNSSPPMVKLWNWMKKEPNIHFLENGNDKPLRYVVFMTDGVNNHDSIKCELVSKPGHYHWRKWKKKQWDISERKKKGYTKVWVGDGVEKEKVCTPFSSYDAATIAACNNMRAAGVKVYSIGYSLKKGRYHRNSGYIDNRSVSDGDGLIYKNYHVEVTDSVQNTAYSLLQSCAYDNSYFLEAADADALNQAFENIGEDIIQELIRISS